MTATAEREDHSRVISGDVRGQALRMARVAQCSWRLYDAECAAHAAHGTHVPEWIAAADAKLHDALVAYRRATESVGASW